MLQRGRSVASFQNIVTPFVLLLQPPKMWIVFATIPIFGNSVVALLHQCSVSRDMACKGRARAAAQ